MFSTACVYYLSHFTKWLSLHETTFPFLSTSSHLSRDVAQQCLAQLPYPPHPQLSALSLFSLCHTLSFMGESHCQRVWKWINPTKRSFRNPFSRPVGDPITFRSFFSGFRGDTSQGDEIEKLGSLWEYAVKTHQIPPLTSLSEFLDSLRPLYPLFIYIKNPSLCSWRLSENHWGDAVMSEDFLRGLIVGWQPWVGPGLRREVAANSSKLSFPTSKMFSPSSILNNDKYRHTVELQCKWRALLQLVPPYFISVESLKTRLLNQTFTPVQNTRNQSNHDQRAYTSLQWEDFTHESPLFHGLEWSLDQYSLRLASCAACINAGCKPDLLQIFYGAAKADDDQMLAELTLPLRQRPVLFYAALGLIARTVPTFFTPLDILQHRYVSQRRTFLADLQKRSITADSHDSITEEEDQWLERHFSHLEPLLDHLDLRFAVEVRDVMGRVIAGQPARCQARLPLSGALVRLHSDFFHPNRGEADPYFLSQFHDLASTKPLDSAGPCDPDTASSIPYCRYEVRLCGVGTPSSPNSLELINKLLLESSSHPFPPCVVIDVVSLCGSSAAVSDFSSRSNKGEGGAQPMALVLGLCIEAPLLKIPSEPCCGEVWPHVPLLGVVHVFTFPIFDSPTRWWCDLPPPILNLLKSDRVLKLLLSGFTDPSTCTGYSYEKRKSFIGSLRWPTSFGILGDLVMLTQFTGCPIGGGDFSIEILTSLLMRRLGVSLHLAATETHFPSFTFRSVAETAAVVHALLLSTQRDTHNLSLLCHGFAASGSSAPSSTTCASLLCASWSSFVRSSPSHRADRALTLRLCRYLYKWFPRISKVDDAPIVLSAKSTPLSEAIECIQTQARIFSLPLYRKKELLMEVTFLYGPETMPQLSFLNPSGRVSQLPSESTKKESSLALISCKPGAAHNLFSESNPPHEGVSNKELEVKWDSIAALEGDVMRVLRKEIHSQNCVVKDIECKEHDENKSSVNHDSVRNISSPSLQTATDNDFLSVLLTPSYQPSPQQSAPLKPLTCMPCPSIEPSKTCTGADQAAETSPDLQCTATKTPMNKKHTRRCKRPVENELSSSFPSPQVGPRRGAVDAFLSSSVPSESGTGSGGSAFLSPQVSPFSACTFSKGVPPDCEPPPSEFGKLTLDFCFKDHKAVHDNDWDAPIRTKKGHYSHHKTNAGSRESPFQPRMAPPSRLPPAPSCIPSSPKPPVQSDLCASQHGFHFISTPKTTRVSGFTTSVPKDNQTIREDNCQSETKDGAHDRFNAFEKPKAKLNTENLHFLLQTEEGRLLLKKFLQ